MPNDDTPLIELLETSRHEDGDANRAQLIIRRSYTPMDLSDLNKTHVYIGFSEPFFPSLGYPCRLPVYNRGRLNYSLTFCSPHSSLKILEQYTTHNYLQRRQVTKPSN
jgi:hypothetical protein